MPKMKTRSAAKKRFRKVGNGLIKRASSFRRHLLTKKSSTRRRQLRKTCYVSSVDTAVVMRLLPY